MTDLDKIKHMEELNWKPASQYWREQCNIKRKKLVEAAEEIERLRDKLENIVIAYCMGWDMDGVIEAANEALK